MIEVMVWTAIFYFILAGTRDIFFRRP